VAGSRAVVRRDDFVRESIPTESPSQETGSFDRHQAGCSLRTPREQRKWLTQVRVLAGHQTTCPGRRSPMAPPCCCGMEATLANSRGEREERRPGCPLPRATRPGFDLATGLRHSGIQLPRSGFVRRSCECCWGPTRSSVASPGSSALLQLRTSGLARAFCSPWAQERIALGLVRRQGY
jgi:hypothetical protein